MTQQAQAALRRRCTINQIMMRHESYRCRLSRITNLFPTTVRFY